MKKKSSAIIIIPFNSLIGDVCDYADQTINVLTKKNNFVLGIALGNPLSIFSNFKGLLKGDFLLKKSKNFYILKPIMFLPFQRLLLFKKISIILNIFLINLIFLWDKRKKILWFFEPRYSQLFLKFLIKNTSIFDCVDDFSSYENMKKEHNYALVKAKNVFVNSAVLKNLFSKIRKGIIQVPLGFYFSPITLNRVANKTKKVFCFVGAIGSRLDFKFINQLVNQRQKDDFVFIGPLVFKQSQQKDKKMFLKLVEEKKIIWLDKIEKKQLLNKIKNYDFGLIPYKKTAFNKHSFPMKVMEYFYLGFPVVSTYIESLSNYQDHVFFPDTSGWEKLNNFLQFSQKKRIEKRKIALANTWDKKVEEILTNFN